MADKEKKSKDDDRAPLIVIKRVKKVAGGHHGGAWKIALADFMTAMFAFFLIMWLVGSVDEQKKKGIAEYFTPVITSRRHSSGSGGLLGGTFLSSEGAKNSDSASSTGNETSDAKEMKKGYDPDEEAKDDKDGKGSGSSPEQLDAEDGKSFNDTSEEIRTKLNENEGIKKLGDNLLIDITHEGLRIQIVDNNNQSMFEAGSANPLPHTTELVKLVSKVIQELPNKISIRGHTDSSPFNKDNAYTNWELSSDRANATRRLMVEAGVAEPRIENVQGKADREQFDTKEPNSPRNRRVSIVLIRQSISNADATKEFNFKKKKKSPETKKREEGVIYFP